MGEMGHHDPISYGKLALALKKKNWVFVVSFFDHFEFLVLFFHIYDFTS
jgi:hypothetical protein